jgi:hypothetical protein
VCGSGANFCLVDDRNPGNFFCGADCSQGQACPFGYACRDVTVVFTQSMCSAASPSCPGRVDLPCSNSADCRHGGTCIIPAGQSTGTCAGKCLIASGDPTGLCTCLADSDCAQDTCVMGQCSISRRICSTPFDCAPIHCVDVTPDAGSFGSCLIGQNCAPAPGLSCLDVK